MRRTLLLFLLIPSIHFGQSSGLYGLYLGWNTSLNSLVGIADIDPPAVEATYVAALVNTDKFAYGDHAVDPLGERYFQVVGDSVHMYLLNFDINTGTLTNILFQVDSVGTGQTGTVTIGGNIQGTFYNCDDHHVYFFHYKAPWEPNIHFSKVNPANGLVTELDSFPLGIQVVDNIVVPDHQIAYWLEYNNITFLYDKLVAYDLVNQTYTSVTMSIAPNSSSYWVMTYSPNDDQLYGIEVDLDSFSVNNYLADLRFFQINPNTGVVTYLATEFLGNVLAENRTLDFAAEQFNVLIHTTNPGYPQLCTYDIPSGTYTYDYFTYIGFGSIIPTMIGLDSRFIPKGCSLPTGELTLDECEDNIFAVLNEGTIHLGCHWEKYMGQQLTIFDQWGRKVSERRIDEPVISFDFSGSPAGIYFYCIVEGNSIRESGKMMVAK